MEALKERYALFIDGRTAYCEGKCHFFPNGAPGVLTPLQLSNTWTFCQPPRGFAVQATVSESNLPHAQGTALSQGSQRTWSPPGWPQSHSVR